ncbi:hypothetical protein [Cylindrospermopsis raciborskii]
MNKVHTYYDGSHRECFAIALTTNYYNYPSSRTNDLLLTNPLTHGW